MADLQSNNLSASNSAEINESYVVTSESGELLIRRIKTAEVEDVLSLTRNKLDATVASDAVVRGVQARNGDSFWGVFRTDGADKTQTLVGYYGFLLLNEAGGAALRNRQIDMLHPRADYLAGDDEVPDTVYIWSMVVPGLSRLCTPIVVKALGKTCAGKPLYATAGTQAGLNLMRRQGFAPISAEDDGIGGLFLFGQLETLKVREPKRVMESRFKVVVVSTPTEMEQARAMRALFLFEQNCPFDEEFDGNDFVGTHFLAYFDGEPAGTLRVRYFADFVKIERLVVLPRYRGTLIAKEMVDTALNFCRRKGYRRAYGHAQKRLASFWGKFGFKPTDRNYPIIYSDHEYVEMVADLSPHGDAITLNSNPYVFVRPEGRWDEEGVLERSASRPATNPH